MSNNTRVRRKLRRVFDRAADGFDSVAALHREIADRMLERLAIIRLSVARVVDAGGGTGYVSRLLRKHFARALVIELDLSLAMLKQRKYRRNTYWPLSSTPLRSRLCADYQCMPLAASGIDLVWSNLAYHWAADLPAALTEAYRVLRPGGLLMFSMFGPDTLKELKNTSAGNGYRVNRFVDMHDIGDVLVHAGFADPVMDMEYVTLTYTDVAGLLRDIRAHGSFCMDESDRKGLAARDLFSSVLQRYEALRREDGRLPATMEIVYGHAWKPEPRITSAGKPIIDIHAV